MTAAPVVAGRRVARGSLGADLGHLRWWELTELRLAQGRVANVPQGEGRGRTKSDFWRAGQVLFGRAVWRPLHKTEREGGRFCAMCLASFKGSRSCRSHQLRGTIAVVYHMRSHWLQRRFGVLPVH